MAPVSTVRTAFWRRPQGIRRAVKHPCIREEWEFFLYFIKSSVGCVASKSLQKSSPNIWMNTTQLAPPCTHDKLNRWHQLSAARLTHAESRPQRGSKRYSGYWALRPGASQESDWGATGTFKGKLPVLLPEASGRGRWLLGGNGVPCRRQRENKVAGPGLPWPRFFRHTLTGATGRACDCGHSPGMGLPLPSSHTGSCRRMESGSHLLPPSHESLQTETWVWETHRLP